jgi:hypothetical protein
MLRIRKRVSVLAEQDNLTGKSLTLSKRFRKHGDAIFRFLFDPAVPPTNNGGEQSIRHTDCDKYLRLFNKIRNPNI